MSSLIIPNSLQGAPRLIAQQQYGVAEAAILSILGATGIMWPLGEWGHDTLSVVTSIGDEQQALTHNVALTALNSPWTRNPSKDEWEGSLPVITFTDDDSDEYAEADVDMAGSGYPFSIGVLVKVSSAATLRVPFSLTDKDVATIFYYLGLDASHQPVLVADDASTNQTITGTALVAGTYHSLIGVFTNATTRILYVDGASDGTGATSVTYHANVDRTSIGRIGDSTPSGYYDGGLVGASGGPWLADKTVTTDEANTLWQVYKAWMGQ